MGESAVGGARLAVGLGAVTLVLFATYSGVLSVLLPAHVARIDPGGKVESLALVTAVSFGVTAIAQPLMGALSDRTRGRWGRRSPWMLGGAVAGGAAVAALGFADSILLVAALWALGQFALNGTDIASTTFIVDRYPPGQRARISAVFVVAAIGGGGVGAVVAGRLSDAPAVAFATFAVAVVLVVAAFVVFVRADAPSIPQDPISVRAFFAPFLIDPRRHPDFAWLFASRFSFGVAYQAIYGYLLYLLSDHIGVPAASAPGLLGVITVSSAASVVVTIIVVAWVSDRLDRRRPFLIGASLGAAAALGFLLLVPEVWVVFVVAAALGISLGVSLVVGIALAAETLPDAVRGVGRGLGLYNMVTNIAQAVGPVVGAFAIMSLGGYPALLTVSLVGMLAAAVLAVPIRRR